MAFCEIQGSDDLLLLDPLVDTELVTDVAALENEEFFVKFLVELALPLESEVCRADDENPLDEAPQLQFPDQ